MSIYTLWLLIVALPGFGNMFSSLTVMLGFICVIGGLVGGVGYFLTMSDEHSSDEEKKIAGLYPKIFPAALVAWFLAAVLSASIPNERQIQYLVGGYFVTNIDGIEKLPPNLVKSANRFLENYTETRE